MHPAVHPTHLLRQRHTQPHPQHEIDAQSLPPLPVTNTKRRHSLIQVFPQALERNLCRLCQMVIFFSFMPSWAPSPLSLFFFFPSNSKNSIICQQISPPPPPSPFSHAEALRDTKAGSAGSRPGLPRLPLLGGLAKLSWAQHCKSRVSRAVTGNS